MRSTALCFAATIASCGAYVLPGAAPGSVRAQIRMDGVINDSIDKENPKVRHCACCHICVYVHMHMHMHMQSCVPVTVSYAIQCPLRRL